MTKITFINKKNKDIALHISPSTVMSQQPRNQMRPGERSDNLGFTHRLPGGTVRPGSRGSARTSELGMGAGFSGQSTQPHGDALQQSMAAEKGFAAGADMGMNAYGNGSMRGGGGGGAGPGPGPGGPRGRGRGGFNGGGPGGPPGRGGGPGFGSPGFGQGRGGGGQQSSAANGVNLPSGGNGYPPQSQSQSHQGGYFDDGTADQGLDAYPPYPPPPPSSVSVHKQPPPPPPTAADGANAAMLTKIRSELASAVQRVTRVEAALPSASGQQQEPLKQFFGIVSGGASGAVLLFPELPATQGPDAAQACAKASRSKWLKLSYPRVRRDFTGDLSVEGASKTAWWYNVHAVDPHTGDYKQLWVCDRSDDGSPAFERFAMYPQ